MEPVGTLVENQRNFFMSGVPVTLKYRIEQLKKLRQIFINHGETLCKAVYKDLKRSPKLTYIIEVSSLIVEIDYVLDHLKEWAAPVYAEKTLVTMLDQPQIIRQPKGVVLLIGPWNYPLNTLFSPLIGVIAAGNTVIVKPSEVAHHTAEAVNLVLSKAFDKRFLAVVCGSVEETTELLKHRYDHIVFTGSTPVGHVILRAAAEHMTPCTLELGGKCPAVVESDTDIEVTARRLTWGKWLNNGQTCISPDYILCNASVQQKLVDAIIRCIYQFYSKDIQNSADYNRIINSRHFDRLANLLKETAAEILFQGGELDRSDLFIPPIILKAALDDSIMRDEIFGPILPIVTITSFQEALDIINAGERPLAAYLFTRDEKKIDHFLNGTTSGGVVINDVIMHITVDTLPFGGVGRSGMGRYHGKFGFDEFSHEKAVLTRGFFADGISSARYPPLTEQKLSTLKRLTGTRRSVPRWFNAFANRFPFVIIGVVFGYLAQKFLTIK